MIRLGSVVDRLLLWTLLYVINNENKNNIRTEVYPIF